MRTKVIIALVFTALLLSLAIVPAATASNSVPGTMPRTTPKETLLAMSSASSLAPMVTATGKITLSLDAAGNNEASSTIYVLKPSPAAAVRSAYMMAATVAGGGRIFAGDISIDGNPITWDVEIPNVLSSYNYWTDVTALVKAKIDAAPAGHESFTIVEVNKNSYIDGEILAVIFDDPAQTTINTIVLLFGSQARGGDTFTINLAEPIHKSDSDLVLDLSLGISYSYQISSNQYSIIDVNGQRLSTAAGGEDDGASYNGGLITVGGFDDSNANPANPYATPGDNPRYDDELYSLSPFVNDGDTSITISTSNPSYDDNLMFAALFMGGISLGEAVDYTEYPVTSTGHVNWFYQTSDSCYGGDAARSGNITDGQSTWLRTIVTGPGPLVFYWKVSSERNGDFLRFYVDHKLIYSISGSVDWHQKSYVLTTSGEHTLEWKYEKDSSKSAGSDCGWVDRVTKPDAVDYAWNKISDGFIEYLKSLGIKRVLRYIGSPNAGYIIKGDELTTLREAGFAIGLMWQSTRKHISAGKIAGIEDATAALTRANSLGFPDSLPIYFCIDYPVSTQEELDKVAEYFDGINEKFGSRPVGAYGGQNVIKELWDDSKISYGMAAAAWGWAPGVWDERIQIRQTEEWANLKYTSSGGKKGSCRLDFDDIWTDDWGGWEP